MRHGIKLSAIAMLGAGVICGSAYAVEQTSVQTQSVTTMNKSASDTFLLENQKKPGVMTLSDGLQYKIIEEGHGNSPKDDDTVVVEYQGTLVDGTKFDSSYDRGQPATFPVAAVIPGWREALKMMKPGAIWELYIPSTLAYGEQGVPGNPGQPPVIGPNQTLIFKVRLVGIKSQ